MSQLIRTGLIALLCTCFATISKEARAEDACLATSEGNRQLVLAFYREGLIGLEPRKAFARYMAPDFIEHKPDVPKGTLDAAAEFLASLIAELPQPRWEVVRTIAENDLVFLHARFTPSPEASSYAIADVFRINGCKIVEHWDVVSPPSDYPQNPNSRF